MAGTSSRLAISNDDDHEDVGDNSRQRKSSAAAKNKKKIENYAVGRGKRSGIFISTKKKDKHDIEDMDAIFNSARSPEPNNESSKARSPSSLSSPTRNKKSTKQTTKPNANQNGEDKEKKPKGVVTRRMAARAVRMSLPGAIDDSDEDDDESSVKPGKFLSKVLASTDGKDVLWSPSDLSHVSTLPPTPIEERNSQPLSQIMTGTEGLMDIHSTTSNDELSMQEEILAQQKRTFQDVAIHQKTPDKPPETTPRQEQSVDSTPGDEYFRIDNQEVDDNDYNNQVSRNDKEPDQRDENDDEDDADDLIPPAPPSDNDDDDDDELSAENAAAAAASDTHVETPSSSVQQKSPVIQDEFTSPEVLSQKESPGTVAAKRTPAGLSPQSMKSDQNVESNGDDNEIEVGDNEDVEHENEPSDSQNSSQLLIDDKGTDESDGSGTQPEDTSTVVNERQSNDKVESQDEMATNSSNATQRIDNEQKTPPPLPQETTPVANSVGNDIYEDGDSDKEGSGFNMVHDPETPESIRAERARKEQLAIDKFRSRKKAARKSTDTTRTSSSKKRRRKSTDENDYQTPVRPRKTSKKKKTTFAVSPMGYPVGNRSYETVPISELPHKDPEQSPENKNIRRSRRARCKPLAFWKNEKQVYGSNDERGESAEIFGDMPMVTGVVYANATPYRKRRVTQSSSDNKNGTSKGKKQKKSSKTPDSNAPSSGTTPFDTSKLKKKYNVKDGETAFVWDETTHECEEMRVVAYSSGMMPDDLPLPVTRKKSEGKKVGKAAQAFNVPNDGNEIFPGYIMGTLDLPPGAIKDAESVGLCAQLFTICKCQPQSLEVSYGDPNQNNGLMDPKTAQRFLLAPGDLFQVPPGNSYRLQNHSKTTECLLSWTIIRPMQVPDSSVESTEQQDDD